LLRRCIRHWDRDRSRELDQLAAIIPTASLPRMPPSRLRESGKTVFMSACVKARSVWVRTFSKGTTAQSLLVICGKS
jgi:hypothetical protein